MKSPTDAMELSDTEVDALILTHARLPHWAVPDGLDRRIFHAGYRAGRGAETVALNERDRERARVRHLIAVLSGIHGLLVSDHVKLPDGRVFEFSNPALEHEMLYALSKAIRAIPDQIAAAMNPK